MYSILVLIYTYQLRIRYEPRWGGRQTEKIDPPRLFGMEYTQLSGTKTRYHQSRSRNISIFKQSLLLSNLILVLTDSHTRFKLHVTH